MDGWMDASNDNTRRPKLALGKKCHILNKKIKVALSISFNFDLLHPKQERSIHISSNNLKNGHHSHRTWFKTKTYQEKNQLYNHFKTVLLVFQPSRLWVRGISSSTKLTLFAKLCMKLYYDIITGKHGYLWMNYRWVPLLQRPAHSLSWSALSMFVQPSRNDTGNKWLQWVSRGFTKAWQ